MGAGASNAAADIASASADELKAALAALPEDTRAKLQTALGGDAGVTESEFAKMKRSVELLTAQVVGLQARAARQALFRPGSAACSVV